VIPRRLTVLHLVANRWWTGSADPVLRLVQALRARGHRALLGLAGGDRFEAKARASGVEPVEGLSLDVKSGPLAIAADARRLRALVSREKVDVVHAHHSHDHWLGWWGRGEAALVRSFHNERAVRRRWPDTSLYRRSDALLAVSRRIEERLLEAGTPRARVHRIDGVVDVARFASDQMQHMRLESKVILPAAREHLTTEDWAEIDRAFAENGDPRFSADNDEGFRQLFARILNLAPDMIVGAGRRG